jgi:26 proteasome complex subunit DSS1
MSNVKPQSNNAKDEDKTEKDESKKPIIPLEEDDEFEDFPVEGNSLLQMTILTFSDWTDAESQSQYTKAAGGETATLWAEEWEDETEETDFSVQLKYYLLR